MGIEINTDRWMGSDGGGGGVGGSSEGVVGEVDGGSGLMERRLPRNGIGSCDRQEVRCWDVKESFAGPSVTDTRVVPATG